MRVLSLSLCLLASAALAEEPSIVASGVGSFAGATDLSAEGDVDRIAALEQQAFRELRWEVLDSAQIALAFDISDDAAAAAQLLISADGETFSPLPETTLAVAGQVLALWITQARVQAETGLSFVPSDWSYDISAAPLAEPEGATRGPILLPIEFGDDLGCAVPGCGEEVLVTEAPDVSGEPRSEAGEAASVAPVAPPDQDLARELQSELARVGCYTLAVDGLWGPGSRRAMGAFNAAQGSELPVEAATPRALVAAARATAPVCEK